MHLLASSPPLIRSSLFIQHHGRLYEACRTDLASCVFVPNAVLRADRVDFRRAREAKRTNWRWRLFIDGGATTILDIYLKPYCKTTLSSQSLSDQYEAPFLCATELIRWGVVFASGVPRSLRMNEKFTWYPPATTQCSLQTTRTMESHCRHTWVRTNSTQDYALSCTWGSL